MTDVAKSKATVHSTSTAPTKLSTTAAVNPAVSAVSTVGSLPLSADTTLDLNGAQVAGVIDKEIFGQLLEMDEDSVEHGFSKPLVEEYIEQAELTLRQIDAAVAPHAQDPPSKLLETLSGRGHFLKGSSAALGLIKVRESCERMQNLGKQKDEAGGELSERAALDACRTLLPQLKREQAEATFWLKQLVPL